MQDLVDRVTRLALSPDLPAEWTPFLRDAVEIGSNSLGHDNMAFRAEWEKARTGETATVSKEFQRRYKFERSPSKTERVAATLGAVTLGGVLTVSLFGVAASDVLVDAYHGFRGDPFYTETQTPDGTVYQAHIQAVPGHPHRYRLLYRAKLHPGEAPGADLQVDAEPPKG